MLKCEKSTIIIYKIVLNNKFILKIYIYFITI